jgi:hypothetical protein
VLIVGLVLGDWRTAHAEEAAPPAALRIVVPDGLTPGSPALIDVFVRLPPGPEQPVLITPSSEGEAVRVTRGRLLRADAMRAEHNELRFQVPVAVLGAGTAVLHVALLTYRCAQRCEAVRLQESRTVQVLAR